MLKRNRSKRTIGFTLVELLLVIAILGIITGFAIPSLIGQKRHARIVGDAKANLEVIAMGMELRRGETGIYGAPADYEYNIQSDGNYTRPTPDIIPSFTPKGNSKMSFKITIQQGGLAYDTEAIMDGKVWVTSNQNRDLQIKK